MDAVNRRGSSNCILAAPLKPSLISRLFAPSLLLIAALLATASTGRAGTLYAIGQVLDEVYVIDTTTGSASLVGVLPPIEPMCGIAFDDAGVLHGTTWSSVDDMELWQLDPWAATAVMVGVSAGPSLEGSLAYDPATDRFYAVRQEWGTTTQELIWIDPDTGVATLVGFLGLGLQTDISGLTFLPDGTLVAYDPRGSLPSRLLEIDKTTAAVTVIGDIGDVDSGSSQGGLAYDADTDTLYMSNTAELWSIDPATGAGTLIGPHGIVDQIDGLSVLPDPCLIGIDLTSTLFDIDPVSGAGTTPRFLGESKFGGLAMNEFGELFGTRTAPIPELYSIDPSTGTATLIGPLGILHEEGGLDFDPGSGELFGVGGVSELFQIDTTTGAATIVGTLEDEFGDPIDPSAMAFDDVGTLFVLKAASVPPEIYQVDPVDGTVLARVPLPGLPLAFHGGMDFEDTTGELFLSYGSVLYRANPYTGATILMGPTPAMSALEVTGACDLPIRARRSRPPRVWIW